MKRLIYLAVLGVLGLGLFVTLNSMAEDPQARPEYCENLVLENECVDEVPIESCEIDFHAVTITDLKAVGELVTLHPGFEANSASSETVHIKSSINPALNSIRGAHGSKDEDTDTDTEDCETRCHMDKVHAFLFGSDYCEIDSDSNPDPDTDWVDPHCPNTWQRTQIHLNPSDTCDGSNWTNTSSYYHDEECSTSGDDVDTTHGIDLAMVFFYNGHHYCPKQLFS